MSNIPIVQGVSVGPDSKYNNNASSYQTVQDHDPAVPLTTQQLEELRTHPIAKFQDVIWAILFVVHWIAVSAVIIANMRNNNMHISAIDLGSLTFVISVSGLTAVGLSIGGLSFMMQHSEILVQTALIFTVGTSLVIAVLGFMMGSMLMGFLGLFSFAVGICYARVVWPRIPFAAVNLETGLTCVRSNLGLTIVSLLFTAIAFAWSLFWFLGVGNALNASNAAIIFVLFLSYYWVHQVLMNTLHVTTAGVTGTWWFVPNEANSFCSRALNDSLFRSLTYSFGSICFGSLLVALVQALRALEYHTRDSDDLQFLSCIIQCILACIQDIIEFMNRWAYVYVGLYGFSYLEAGRNVIELFNAKGWTAIISDDLVGNVLFMMSLAIGIASGLVGLIIGFMDVDMFASIGFDQAAGPGFFIGFLTGLVFASIIMSVVSSAVNTVIVCYAEDPATFQMHYPELAAKMRDAWIQAWPGLVY